VGSSPSLQATRRFCDACRWRRRSVGFLYNCKASAPSTTFVVCHKGFRLLCRPAHAQLDGEDCRIYLQSNEAPPQICRRCSSKVTDSPRLSIWSRLCKASIRWRLPSVA
jgi:hypothetical protein